MMRNKGFTMVEMMLVTTVLMIVVAMAFPNIQNFIFLGKEKLEAQQMQEIQRALSNYSKHQRRLPDETDWAEDLAPYTKLSEREIETDQWGNARVYMLRTANEMFKEGKYTAYYGVVYSYGSNGCKSIYKPCDMTNPTHTYDTADFASVGNIGSSNDFSVLAADSGDFLVKYSDVNDKIEAYKTTKLRLDKISDALSEYEEGVYAEAVFADTEGNNMVFVPPNNIDAVADVANIYHAKVLNQIADVIVDPASGRSVVNASTTLAGDTAGLNARRLSMQSLMRFLGLPEEYCCSALTVYDRTGNGDYTDEPFYYYSNPRQRTPLNCNARPKNSGDPKFPARVSTLPKDDVGVCG